MKPDQYFVNVVMEVRKAIDTDWRIHLLICPRAAMATIVAPPLHCQKMLNFFECPEKYYTKPKNTGSGDYAH